MRSSKEKRVKAMLSRATMEALQTWDKMSRPIQTTVPALLDSVRPMGLIRDTVARGDLCSVHGVMRSMGAFGGAEHQCEDSASQVAVAGGGAAVAQPEFSAGAAAIETNVDVDCQILRIGAYFHFRIMRAVRDTSYVASASTLLESFGGLCCEATSIVAATAGNADDSSSLSSAPQGEILGARNGVVGVFFRGESRPIADQSNGRIALREMVPVWRADVLGICGMGHALAFTGAKSSAMASDFCPESVLKSLRMRVPMTMSGDMARTPVRLSCPASVVTTPRWSLQRAGAVLPMLGAYSPSAAAPTMSGNRARTSVGLGWPTSVVAIAQRLLRHVDGPARPTLGARPVQRVDEPEVPMLGAYSPPAAAPSTTSAREKAAFAKSMVADAVAAAVKSMVVSREERAAHALDIRGVHAVHGLIKAVDLDDGASIRHKKREGKAEQPRSAEHGEGFEASNVSSAPRGSCVNSCNGLGESPLHVAASVGNIAVVQALLACGAGVEATDSGGATPLHVAGARSRHNIVLALLKGGAPVGKADMGGKTALHVACDLGGQFCLATIDALLEHGASTARTDKRGFTPLHVAIMSLKYETVSSTSEPRDKPSGVSGATAGPQNKRASVSEAGSRKESTPLSASVNQSGEEVFEFLLAHGAPVGALDHTGKSPLCLACERGHLGVARVLLCAGASPGLGGEEGVNPLHTACSRGDVGMVKLLLEAGALPGHCRNSKGVSPLHVAAEWGRLGAVNALLPRLNKRQINMEDHGRKTPLIVAVERRDAGIVDALMKAGADLTAWAPWDIPLLSVIAAVPSNSDSVEVVRLLLKRGAQPGQGSLEGVLPLHAACKAGGDAGVVQALLDGGADINCYCAGDEFLLPLHLAARSGHTEAVRALVATAGCSIHEKANNRATALTMAVQNGHTDTVRALLESGAVLENNVLDENGVNLGSHVRVAALHRHADTCRFLLKAVAPEAKTKEGELKMESTGGVMPAGRS